MRFFVFDPCHAIYGVGKTLKGAVANASRWTENRLTLDEKRFKAAEARAWRKGSWDEQDFRTYGVALVRESRNEYGIEEPAGYYWREGTDRLADAVKRDSGDIGFRVNSDGLLDVLDIDNSDGLLGVQDIG